MVHGFDTDIAQYFHDTNIAVIFHNLCYWIAHNKANEKNRQEIEINGITQQRYFTYNSVQAFQKQFPYFSARQIEHSLKKLRDNGFIVKTTLNKIGFDRTAWFCLVDEEYWMNKYLPPSVKNSNEKNEENTPAGTRNEVVTEVPEENESSISQICEMESTKMGNPFHKNVKWNQQKCEMDFTEMGNGFHRNVRPIPDSKPDSNTSTTTNNVKVVLNAQNVFLSDEVYEVVADFLFQNNIKIEYLTWLIDQIKPRAKTSLSGLFFAVYKQEAYVQNWLSREKESVQSIRVFHKCIVCSYRFPKDTDICPHCGLSVNATNGEVILAQKEYEKMKKQGVEEFKAVKQFMKIDNGVEELCGEAT